jgi:hypothetical protein
MLHTSKANYVKTEQVKTEQQAATTGPWVTYNPCA